MQGTRCVTWQWCKYDLLVSVSSVTFFSPSPRRKSSNLGGTLSSAAVGDPWRGTWLWAWGPRGLDGMVYPRVYVIWAQWSTTTPGRYGDWDRGFGYGEVDIVEQKTPTGQSWVIRKIMKWTCWELNRCCVDRAPKRNTERKWGRRVGGKEQSRNRKL